MPSRLLREGILTSEKVEQLDPAEEVFYRRLMSKVDDHGLYDGRPSILRTSLFPLRVDRVSEDQIRAWVAKCELVNLLRTYEVGGKPFIQMLNTGWDKRSQPKYPLATENNCLQPRTSVPPVVVGDVVVGEVCTEDLTVSAPVAHLPLVDGSEWGITEADIVGWRKAFPAVDVKGQLLRMREWILANPSKRKTRKGIRRFVVTWLGKEQDRGGKVLPMKPRDDYAGVK